MGRFEQRLYILKNGQSKVIKESLTDSIFHAGISLDKVRKVQLDLDGYQRNL